MSRVLRPTRHVLAVAVVLLVMLVAVESVALAANLNRNGGAVKAVRTATDDSVTSTASISFVQVPGMSATVTVPGGQQALLVITFSSYTECVDGDGASTFCYLQVRVNNNVVSPGPVLWRTAQSDESGQVSSMQFVSGPLNAGSYTVRVEYRVDEQASAFVVGPRTLTILRSRV